MTSLYCSAACHTRNRQHFCHIVCKKYLGLCIVSDNDDDVFVSTNLQKKRVTYSFKLFGKQPAFSADIFLFLASRPFAGELKS